MKKVLSSIALFAFALLVFAGCASPQQEDGDIPAPPQRGDAIEPSDYTDEGNWLSIADEPDKPVDVFYLYPTAWTRQSDEPYVSTIDNASMREGAPGNLASQASAYEDAGNVFAPYYRQLDAMYLLPLSLEEQESYVYGVPYTDVVAAFEYYLEHFNDGRPFILAGHSQGSEMVKCLLIDYMKEHPDVYEHMVAAYVIGYSVTQQELDNNPHLKFAEGSNDTGVVVSFNTEAPEIEGASPVALPGSVAINPLTWTRTDEPAQASENLGSRFYDETGGYEDVAGFADATVNLERGTVVCSTVDVDEFSFPEEMAAVFPRGVFHASDYPFYYHNIRENAVKRAQSYLYEHSGSEHVVDTAYGQVKGVAWDGVVSYKGIPFAEPPIGDKRFSPPQDLQAWDGVLDCREYAPMAIQTADEPGLEKSEDCLYLNIWKPEEQTEELAPVLVFIHGGAFTQGSASKSMYDGTRFVQDGVVQVNISYRLNGLGFLTSEELEDETGYIGNAGMLDQIAGLRWVQENIERFGGDPNNVTISGESAGSFSVSNLILSPLAEGLFHKAIMESGNVLGQPLVAPLSNGDKSQALGNAERLMESLEATSLDDMRKADALAIAENSNFVMDIIHPSDTAFFPVFDGVVLPENPYQALADGAYNSVDILGGYNTDEGTLFVEEGISEQDYVDLVEAIFGENAPAVLERYPVDEANSATDRARFMMKMGLRAGTDVFADKLSADGRNVYLYHFDYRIAALDEAGLGTMHALELPFVFDTFSPTTRLSEDDRAFADDAHNRWLNFVRSGNPNEGAPVGAEWEAYSQSEKQTMTLSQNSHLSAAEGTEDVAFLMSLIWGE